ncbi:MAG: sulfurtransferase, partial [Gammaproteobacteria bacterium]
MKPLLPLIVEPAELEQCLGHVRLFVVDLCPMEIYEDVHVPGAVHLDRTLLTANQKPEEGALPNEKQLSKVL